MANASFSCSEPAHRSVPVSSRLRSCRKNCCNGLASTFPATRSTTGSTFSGNRPTTRIARDYLRPYLDVPPGPGYLLLARLIKNGFFDLVLSFNFDNLLEKALDEVDFRDYSVVMRGTVKDEEMQKLVDAKEPRCKLVKLHGSVRGSKHFLCDLEEMYQYPPAIEALVKLATARDIVVCGYAFNDFCVVRAFADQGGTIVSVNIDAVPKGLRVKVKNRKSDTWAIKAEFDSFFKDLHAQLVDPRPPTFVTPPNPFKFLESYEEDDRDIMLGREEETERFFKALNRAPPPRVIVVAGPGKVGKTSFVRGRLMPGLDAAKYRGVYLRCQSDLEVSLPRGLKLGATPEETLDLPASLKRLAELSADRRVVVFLDQFDRVTTRFEWRSRVGMKQLSDYLRDRVWKGSSENMTIVLIVSDESTLGGMLCQEASDNDLVNSLVMCVAFDRQEVVNIIQSIASNAGFEFDPQIIEDMARKYEQSRNSPMPDKRFTLAHIQAVCHLLAGKQKVDYASYEAFAQNLNALHQAINVVDIISFVEDLAWTDAVWLRNIIKVPLKESKEKIAEFIRKHYEDLVPRSAGSRARPAPPVPQRTALP